MGLCGISSRFQLLSPSLRQVPHALLTRSPLNTEKINPLRIPFDLHVLGAPPAFVLSQDQTLYKMIFITLKVLNLVHSARNRLRPVNYSLEFLSVPYTLKVPLQVFDIVQFSRSCVRRPVDRRPVYCSTARRFCQALFSSFFKRCGSALFFHRPLGGGLPAGRSHIVLLFPPLVTPFFQLFSGLTMPSDTSRKSSCIFGQHSENTKCSV